MLGQSTHRAFQGTKAFLHNQHLPLAVHHKGAYAYLHPPHTMLSPGMYRQVLTPDTPASCQASVGILGMQQEQQ